MFVFSTLSENSRAWRSAWLALFMSAALWGTSNQTAAGQDLRRDSFESGPASGFEMGSDTEYRVLEHQRVQGDAHSGQAGELWHIAASNGSFVNVGYSTPHARVIEELSFSIWAKSDRGGPSLMAQVVLPRTVDPRTGRPAVVTVRGTVYRDTGHWEELRVTNLRQEVTRAAQRLRSEIEAEVDEREAYVDQLIVNIYAGPGETRLLLDDVEVRGLVERNATVSSIIGESEPVQHRAVDVRRSGTQLLVNGEPFFPRAIQYRGESLGTLRQLGFNSIHVDQPPNRQLLDEAAKAGLWIIAPPPMGVSTQGKPQLIESFGPEWESILVWDLGMELGATDHAWVHEISQQLHERTGRPVVCSAAGGLRELSRSVDIFCPHRRPLESSLDLNDYSKWLHEHPRLTRPGIPRWTLIQTEPAQSTLRQQAGLAGMPLAERVVDFDALRLMVYNAIATGVRGIIFTSRTSLDQNDELTRRRGMMLELLNLELTLIEPWAAGGNVTATVRGNQPFITAAVLRTERARLLLPMWTGPDAQFAPGQAAGHGISITAPGVPETDEAYEITPGGRFRTSRSRVAGGVLITLNEFDLTSQVLLTQDARIVNFVSQQLAQVTHRAVQLRRELLVARLRDVEVWNRRMSEAGLSHSQASIWLSESQSALTRCEASLAAGDDGAAYTHALRAARPLRMLEQEQFQKFAGGQQRKFLSSPLSMSTRTIPEMAAFVRRMDGSSWNLNLLPGGDCENLQRMIDSGWNHQQQIVDQVSSAADLAYGGAHSGAFSLRLRVAPHDPGQMPGLLETAPLWISTPPVTVTRGDIIRVRGWVKIPAPITGCVDGLAIADSLGGAELMLRIGVTDGWQEFVLYRYVEDNAPFVVTLALFGVGEAYLDDVTVETLRQPQGLSGTLTAPRMGGLQRLPTPPGGGAQRR